ncbi:MAG: hypothetical protein B6244_12900 [Candidatus Cloacimonetes bacterium 4572_55]|nr:MAG: hypothetical protein B6244_12900 [Candidatus Cloacimonetes bacterium 4572_55]
MKAKVTLTGGMQFVGQAGSDHAIVLDTVPAFGGHNSGLKPYDLFLVGLVGCTAMDAISILRKKRQHVTRFQVEAEAEQAKTFPKVFTRIHVTYRIEGYNINPNAVKRAIELSESVYCPAYATLSKTATITNDFKIVELAQESEKYPSEKEKPV